MTSSYTHQANDLQSNVFAGIWIIFYLKHFAVCCIFNEMRGNMFMSLYLLHLISIVNKILQCSIYTPESSVTKTYKKW